MMRIGLLLATNFAVLLIAGVVISLLGLDQQTGGGLMGLLIICSLFGFGGSLISLFISKFMAKRSSGTQLIETPSNETEKWLVDRVTQLAEKSGIGTPDIGIFPSDQPNAFATGWNKNKALVAVSAGLLNNFPKDEVDAVLAHEIGHVANGDMVTLTLIQGITNTFVLFFSRLVGMAVAGAARNRAVGRLGYMATSIIAQIVFGLLASIIVMWFSRRREFRADEAGARLTTPHAMANALERLKHPVRSNQPEAMPEALAAFGISAGFSKKLGGMLATHPSLDDRIAALRANM